MYKPYVVWNFRGLTQVEPKKCMDYIQRLFISTQRITGEIQAAEEEETTIEDRRKQQLKTLISLVPKHYKSSNRHIFQRQDMP